MLPLIIKIQIREKYDVPYQTDEGLINNMESISRGKEIFKNESCSSCHKLNKKGRNLLRNI